MNRIGVIQRNDIGIITKEKLVEIGKELNKRLLIPFQQKGLKRDHPLIIGKEFIEGIFDDIPFKELNVEDELGFQENNFVIVKSEFGSFFVDQKDFKNIL